MQAPERSSRLQGQVLIILHLDLLELMVNV